MTPLPSEKNPVPYRVDRDLTDTGSSCSLCGLQLPKRPHTATVRSSEFSFCCIGCRQVFILLSETLPQGTDFTQSDLYQTSLKLGIIGKPDRDSTPNEPTPEELAGTEEITLHVGGMWCSSCSWLIEKVVGSTPGVVHTRVMYASDTARINFRPEQIGADTIISNIRKLGYSPSHRDADTDERSRERTNLLVRMGVALFLMNNIMFFSYTMYIGYFQDIPREILSLVPHIMLGLALPSILWCAWPIHRKALRSALALAPTMELLFSIGILSSFGYSVITLVTHGVHYYFDTAAALVALFLVGKFIEQGAKRKASEDIHRLYQLLPRKVRVILGGDAGDDERMIPTSELRIGDRFLVKAGEKIPADGLVMQGRGVVDESLLTGEATPIEKLTGDTVVASSMNINGTLIVEATRIGADTVLSKIIGMVERAFGTKSPLEQTVDKITRIFIPVVLFVAFATGFVMLALGFPEEIALLRGITVLLIACPCALGMATPLAIAAGIGLAAKKGILIADTAALQRLAKIDTVVFDKTGTLTEGRFSVQKVVCETNHVETLRLVGSIEHSSHHPIALAIVAACRTQGISLSTDDPIPESSGTGLIGLVANRKIVVGNEAFVNRHGFFLDTTNTETLEREVDAGKTVVFVGIEGNSFAGYIALGDSIKNGTTPAVSDLTDLHCGIHLVSGDAERTTRAIARAAGIDLYVSQALPHQKIEYVQKLQQTGKIVAMIGDGVNDAPALAQSDVGIAIGEGTEIAIASATVTLLRNDLLLIPESITIAKRTMTIVRQNLAWSFFYNSVGIVLAIAGVLNPLMGAAAMLASSISVIANSMRLRR